MYKKPLLLEIPDFYGTVTEIRICEESYVNRNDTSSLIALDGKTEVGRAHRLALW